MDTVVLSHISALQGLRAERRKHAAICWDRVGRQEAAAALAACRPNLTAYDFDYLDYLGFWSGVPTERLNVLMASASARSRKPNLACHVFSRPLPAGALVRTELGLYCTSAAFTAYLYARHRSLPEVFSLLMELLGTYSLPEEATMPIAWGGTWPDANGRDTVQQVHYRCDPAVTLRELKAMASWTKSSADAVFRSAVDLAVKASASPAETICYGMLALPMRHGGLALSTLPRGVLLNHRINFERDAVRMASGMPYAIADMYIPSARTDIEYNGIGHEVSAVRVHDGQRNNGMRGMGIKVIVINRDQMRDVTALEAIARSIYRDAGVRFRCQVKGYRVRQYALLNGLRKAAGLPPA